ncbi:KRFJ protein, partial [Grus americana]|nr:KRFJ protein [Grus americana]
LSRAMSYCGDLCVPYSSPCEVTCPQPLTNACNELCVTSCDDSRAVIYPPPVVLTFPGPILSSCPQESVVGSCGPLGVGHPCGSGGYLGYRGYGNAAGLRGSILFGGSNGYGGACNYSRSYNSGYSSLGRGNFSPN